MAREQQRQQEVSVTQPQRVVPPDFDPGRPYTDAHYRQEKYWVQNGWLYRRGTLVPVREA